jgi:cell division protein FtsI (penicillin-binding protein 3)
MKIGDKWISEAETKDKFQNLTVTEILAYSSNIGVAKIAFQLGAERLRETLLDFGIGEKTGVTLPGEARGILSALPWRPHLLSNIAFGHGVAVTPLQMAVAYTAIANGGLLRRPVLVRAINDHDQKQVTEFHSDSERRVLSPADAATLRLMLTAATGEHATGVNARIPGYPVAGKTGTAQKVDLKNGGYIDQAYISSFAGFVPASSPRYVIYLSVDDPKKAYYGSQVAAPVFARMAQYLVRRAGLSPILISERNVIPNEPSETESGRQKLQTQALEEIRRIASAPDSTEEADKVFPNLMGLTLREAMAQVRNDASGLRVKGHGLVVRTVPAAGTQVTRRQNVTLILENPD